MKYPQQNIEAKMNGCGNVSIQVIFTTEDGDEYIGIYDFDNKE